MKAFFFSLRAIFVYAILLMHTFNASSQEVKDLVLEGKNIVEMSILKGDEHSYAKAITLFERAISADPTNKLALYYRSYAEFRLLMQTSGENEAATKTLMTRASEHAEILVQKYPYWSDAMTLLAGIIMLQIDGMNAIMLAPKCTKLHEASLAADINNPRAYIVRGLYTTNAPAFFGGGPDKALQNFTQAITLCEKNSLTNVTYSTQLTPAWGYLDALIWAGRTHVKLKQYNQGIAYFKKVLAIAPEYAWVKQTLLPRAEQKLTVEASSK